MRCAVVVGLLAQLVAAWVCAALPVPTAWAQDGARRERSPARAPAPSPSLTRPPELVLAVQPEYPADELVAGVEATVTVRIAVDEHGAVDGVEVVRSAGPAFDRAALAAARAYHFRPALWDGQPGPILVETDIQFRLAPQVAPGPGATGGVDRVVLERTSASGSGTIRGTALERSQRQPLAGVVVSIVELGLDATTDDQGRFTIGDLPPGTYTIVALDPAYARFTRTVTLALDEAIDLRLYLRSAGSTDYQTLVEGEGDVFQVTRRRLERRQLSTVPGTFGDPIRVVQSLPGLARTPFGTGFLLIRGSFANDSGIFVDGHQVPLLFHLLGGPSFLNPEFLGRLDLYPGGFPARYGRAQGGIVAVETRAPGGNGLHGAADIDFLDAGGYVRAPLGKRTAVAVAGRRSYINSLLPLFMPDPEDGSTLVVTPVYQDYNARLDHDLGRHGTLTLFAFGSDDRLDVLSQNPDDEENLALDSGIGFFRLIATYRRPITSNLQLTLSGASGRDRVDVAGSQFAGSDPKVGIDVYQTALSYRMSVNGNVSHGLHVDAGIDIASRVTRYDLLVPMTDDFRTPVGAPNVASEQMHNSLEGLNLGLFAELAADWRRLRLIPGLRADTYSLAGQERFSFDPRLVARYRASASWTAKGYAGLFHQAPQPEQFDIRFGNPNLRLERALHTGLGAEWRPRPLWSADMEVYYIHRANQAAFTDEVRTADDGTVRPLRNVSTGDGYTAGVELLLRRELTADQYGWLSYTLSYTRTRDAPDEDYVFMAFDQRHILNAVYSYVLGGGWELGGRFRLASGTPTTPVIGATFDADTNRHAPATGALGSARRPLFHQLDLRVERTWRFATWSLAAYLDVQNLFNVKNVEATQYDYRFRASAPVTSLPILPTLGVKGQF
jgi:TonB family protein